MRKLLATVFILMLGAQCFADIHKVGSTKTYKSPNALYTANVIQDGDTIEIDAETYSGQAALAIWKNNNLVIKGVSGRPHLTADGQQIAGKGIWVFSGNNITVENIEFSGSSVPDKNGAGIRFQGIGLSVRHCYFHDNENGILAGNPYEGDILIEFSEFARNGYGDGYSHNLYIGHINKLTFRFNYSHHADIGHNLKSRANENFVLYNRIMDEKIGNSSRLIDLPNGGLSIVMGNLLMQGNSAKNSNMVGFGLEGLTNSSPHELYFINNTLVNKKSGLTSFLDIKNGTATANVSNNIFAGTGTVVKGSTTLIENNLIDKDISNLSFIDESNYDYRLNSNSPAKDHGITINPVNGHSLTPNLSYAHIAKSGSRSLTGSSIDSGAYEFNGNRNPIFTLPQNQWRQISLPSAPPSNADTVELVFGGKITGNYGPDWMLYSYNTSTNSYESLDLNSKLEQGKAYWIIQLTDPEVALDMPAGTTPTPVINSSQCASINGCYEIPLGPLSNPTQWSMIGFPFPNSIQVKQLRVVTDLGTCGDNDGCKFDEASAADIFHNQLWTYNGTTYDILRSSDLLYPWAGFWAATLKNATGLHPKLLIPAQ